MNPTQQDPFYIHFHAFELVLGLIHCLRQPVQQLQSQDPSLTDQIRRAANSVALNLSEGNRRTGKDRKHLWRIAAGSADEVRAGLRIAEAWGYLDRNSITEPMKVLDRVLRMLWKLTH